LVGLAGLAFALLACETAFMFYSDRHLHLAASQMESQLVPVVGRMVAIRSRLIRLASCFGDDEVQNPLECADTQLRAIDADAEELWRAPYYPGRVERLTALDEALQTVHARRVVLDLGGKRPSGPAVTALLRSLPAITHALDELARANLHHLTEQAASMSEVRHRSELVEVLLTAVAVSVAMAATVAGIRSMRRHNRFLQAKTQELEHFAGTVAHDVLGPLSAVGLTMPMILQRNPGDDQTQRLTERALSSVRRVRELVNGLLEFARAGAQPSGGRTDVRATVDDVLCDLSRDADAAGVTIETEIEEGFVACAPGVLLSILSNLLRNAVKYMGANTGLRRVVVRTRGCDGRVDFEVEDTGPGIPEPLHDVVFEPYVRVTPHAGPGMGLGLATVKRLVNAHGGSVGVRTAGNGGSLFWFDLPCA
jgi:signal transduction histidine kinase